MGNLGTLDGFKLELIMDKLNIPEGFSIRAKSRETMIIITVEDLRQHPEFEGDKLIDRWPDIFQSLCRIGLDPAKAIVSLGCRSEAIKADGKLTFNIGVVQLGWGCATSHRPIHDRAPAPAPAPEPTLAR